MDLDPGTVVANRYRITRPLGRGGMGEVFAAEQLRTGRPVAVKLLRQDSKSKSTALKRFEQEALAAGQIKSDYVTEILAVEEDPEHGLVLVFELLEGESLIDRLKRTGPIAFDELHPIIEQVWMGLADAHKVGIIHRDLKPSNVFLERRSDGTTRVKILDFGISKVPKEVGGETLTEMGQSLGTFSFMPPEQIGKAKTVDQRADIYACATLIYQSLTGQLPYAARNILVMVEMKTKSDARPLRDATTVPLDPRLEAFVACGLQRDPDKRFQSAMDALAAWRELRPVPGSGRGPSSGPVAQPPSSGSTHTTGLRLGSTPQSHFKMQAVSSPVIQEAGALPRINAEMSTEETAATLAMPINRMVVKPGQPAARPPEKATAPPLEPRLDSAAAGISAPSTSAGLGPAQILRPQQGAPGGTAILRPQPVGPGGTQPVMPRDIKRLDEASQGGVNRLLGGAASVPQAPPAPSHGGVDGNLPHHPAGYYVPPAVAASLARTSGPAPRPPAESAPQGLPRAYDDGGVPEVATTLYRPNKGQPGESSSSITAPPAPEGAVTKTAPPAPKKGSASLVLVLVSCLLLGFLAVAGAMYLFRGGH